MGVTIASLLSVVLVAEAQDTLWNKSGVLVAEAQDILRNKSGVLVAEAQDILRNKSGVLVAEAQDTLWNKSGVLVAKAQDTLWNKANCNEEGTGAIKGLVVDAVCANAANNCPSKTDSNSCGASVGCTWDAGVCKWDNGGGCLSRTTKDACGADRCKWEGGSCIWNRDAHNNVCLHPPASHATLPDATRNCADILKGRCPLSWEVPTGCCLEEHSKYELLLTSTPGFVCCNAPCTSLEASHKSGAQVLLFALAEVTTGTGLVVANQTVCNGNMGSTLCAPGMRSYFGAYSSGGGGGLMDKNIQMSIMGMYGGRPMYGGRVVGGYGTIGLPGMGFMNQVDLDSEGLNSKEGHVEE